MGAGREAAPESASTSMVSALICAREPAAHGFCMRSAARCRADSRPPSMSEPAAIPATASA